MRNLLLVLMAVFMLGGAGTVYAADAGGTVIDFGVGFGTEPAGGFGTTFGFGVGVEQDFGKLFSGVSNEFTENLRLRADFHYFGWDDTISVPGASADIEFSRIPIFLGGRYALPVGQIEKFTLFGEAGLEISIDDVEAGACIAGFPPFIPSTCTTVSDSEVNFGVTPGIGVTYLAAPNVAVGVDLRYHLISDGYFTGVASIGYVLP
jgi:opacity protein-like surface antigen